MVEFLAVKRMNGDLHPTDEVGETALRRIGAGELVKIDVKRPRNSAFHGKFFAMLNIIYKNQSHYKSLDQLLGVCKIRTGHVDVIQTKHGVVELPKSISFAAMDDDAFADFYDRACQWVCEEVIPGLQRGHLNDEVAAELRAFGAPEG